MSDKLESSLEKVKSQMTDPATADVQDSQETKKMATAKKASKKKVATKKTANGNGAAKKDTDGMVSLKSICSELKLAPRLARIKLRKAEVENPGRWSWKEGSGDLTKVKKLLSATAE